MLSRLSQVTHIFMIWALFNFRDSFPYSCPQKAAYKPYTPTCFHSRYQAQEAGRTNVVTVVSQRDATGGPRQRPVRAATGRCLSLRAHSVAAFLGSLRQNFSARPSRLPRVCLPTDSGRAAEGKFSFLHSSEGCVLPNGGQYVEPTWENRAERYNDLLCLVQYFKGD